ncbi:UNVERIFIED_CONTAM: hypothetical protein Sradi_2777600 [Sesamum radiatum]|uniref:Uncharacterized protein n=1 Tax=Sesamum radiatum TaxID=300843 RepID=A0AAW2S9A7_SESRA
MSAQPRSPVCRGFSPAPALKPSLRPQAQFRQPTSPMHQCPALTQPRLDPVRATTDRPARQPMSQPRAPSPEPQPSPRPAPEPSPINLAAQFQSIPITQPSKNSEKFRNNSEKIQNNS